MSTFPRDAARRFHQVLLIASILWLSWLAFMLVHECGHVVGAVATGGTVQQVVWHPAALSRTDVQPNPHPLIEVAAGPVFGIAFPLAVASAASWLRLKAAYLTWTVAGFCLIANGAYVALGAFDPICDARQLFAHSTPRWLMVTFGLLTIPTGLWIWHRASPRFGLGRLPNAVNPRHAYVTFTLAAIATLLGLLFGNRGP
jgi:hypothetical protein